MDIITTEFLSKQKIEKFINSIAFQNFRFNDSQKDKGEFLKLCDKLILNVSQVLPGLQELTMVVQMQKWLDWYLEHWTYR